MRTAALQREPALQDADLLVRRLQPTIGAEIEGVDLSRPISDAVRDAIKAAILKDLGFFGVSLASLRRSEP